MKQFLDHVTRLRNDADTMIKNRGVDRTLGIYRAAFAAAVRDGRSNDAADLAFKIAHVTPNQFPPSTYHVQFRYYGPSWITFCDPNTCKPLAFDSRHAAELFADSLTNIHTRVKGV